MIVYVVITDSGTVRGIYEWRAVAEQECATHDVIIEQQVITRKD
jgi:hypothetical protein